MAVDPSTGRPDPRVRTATLAGVAAVALAARLVPVLRGGGLTGLGNYDDGVHFTTALALTYGVFPYRDFLFLQPPGIAVALLPFAGLSRLTEDPVGLVAARIAWMGLGVLNALLIVRLLRPLGSAGSAVGGLAYALYLPAAYTESMPLLEPLGTTLLLVSLLIVGPPAARGTAVEPPRLALAGAVLGLAATVKIWSTVTILVLTIWLVLHIGRAAWVYLAAAVGSCAAVCLPFFVGAPREMWQDIVLNQLGRRRFAYDIGARLEDVAGVVRPSRLADGSVDAALRTLDPATVVLAVLVLTLVAVAMVASLRVVFGRLVVLLFAVQLSVLVVAPSWFLHYAAWLAPLIALSVGIGVQQWCRRGARVRAVIGLVLVAALAGPALLTTRMTDYDGRAIAAGMADRPGCVTTDEPTALVLAGLMTRNLDQHCPLVVDLGGRSYDRSTPEWGDVARRRNTAWQAYALDYLRSGSYTMVVRFNERLGFSTASMEVVRSWPVVVRAGRWTVREPS